MDEILTKENRRSNGAVRVQRNGPISNYKFYESLDLIVLKSTRETKRPYDHSGDTRPFVFNFQNRITRIARIDPCIMSCIRDCLGYIAHSY